MSDPNDEITPRLAKTGDNIEPAYSPTEEKYDEKIAYGGDVVSSSVTRMLPV